MKIKAYYKIAEITGVIAIMTELLAMTRVLDWDIAYGVLALFCLLSIVYYQKRIKNV